MAYADVEAPISGVIMQRMVEVGTLVRSNQELFFIADMDPLLVRIFVPERRMYQLKPGQGATVAVEALPGRIFEGKIRMISPRVDPESGTVKVTLEVPASGMLKPGMFLHGSHYHRQPFERAHHSKESAYSETDADDVFAVKEGKVEIVNVELGFVEGDRVEVVSGLEEGMQVVTVGHEGLKDGAGVRVVGEEGASGAEQVEQVSGDEAGEKRPDEGSWGRSAGGPPAGGRPGGALPDSLRQLIAKFRAEGKELPDSLRQKLRALRGGGRSGGEQGGGRRWGGNQMKLVDFSTRRRVTVAMLMVAIVVFGGVGFSRLAVNLLPDITYPTITVRTEYPGVAPFEIERLISEPAEGLVGVVSNVVRVNSISRPGVSDVIVEFAWGTNMDFASLDLREKLDLVTFHAKQVSRSCCALILHLIPLCALLYTATSV